MSNLQGKRNGMGSFAWHHFSHAHNDLTTVMFYQVLTQRRWPNLSALKPKTFQKNSSKSLLQKKEIEEQYY